MVNIINPELCLDMTVTCINKNKVQSINSSSEGDKVDTSVTDNVALSDSSSNKPVPITTLVQNSDSTPPTDISNVIPTCELIQSEAEELSRPETEVVSDKQENLSQIKVPKASTAVTAVTAAAAVTAVTAAAAVTMKSYLTVALSNVPVAVTHQAAKMQEAVVTQEAAIMKEISDTFDKQELLEAGLITKDEGWVEVPLSRYR